MRHIVAVLKVASTVESCGGIPNNCKECLPRNQAMGKKYPEALLECRKRGYVTWKPPCGWTLTPDGKHFYNALRGIYNEEQKRTVKPIE